MGADLPDEADDHADRRDDQTAHGGRSPRPDGAPAETRFRQECYDDLRRHEAAQKTAAAREASAEEQAAYEKWEKNKEESRWMWSEYQRRWPSSDRPKANRPDAEEGSWQGEGDSFLSRADNERVEGACDRIAKLEKDKITPAMREVESQDPDRHLVGLDHCRKGRDRIKEKICRSINNFGRSPEQAVSRVPDAVRFTFEYREARYTQGVWTEIERLKQQGFKLKILKNSWTDDQYKGINSQWVHPESGQRFEVQFHTRISFEAKQLTHKAYERIRTEQPDAFEQMVLEAFQKKVAAEVPVPLGAADIPDYRERNTDAR